MVAKRLAHLASDNPRLTAVNMMTLQFCAEGLTTEEQAQLVHRSQYTVKSRISRLIATFGAKNCAHAVALAYQKGILVGPERAVNQELLAANAELREQVADLRSRLARVHASLAEAKDAHTGWPDTSQGKL